MKTFIFIFYILLALFTSILSAEQITSNSQQPENKTDITFTTYYFDKDWKPIKQPVENGFYRKILHTTAEGWFVVQDFYQASNIKQSDPITLRAKSDLTAGSPTSIEGSLVLWHENGKKSLEVFYKNGKEQGLLQKWYDTGIKETERNFINGKENGIAILWDAQGNKNWEVNYKDGVLDGPMFLWENGKKTVEANYLHGIREGINIYIDKEDNKHVMNYRDGKLNGSYKTYYPNGNKQSEFEYIDDEPQEQSKLWHTNGQLLATINRNSKAPFCQIWDETANIIYEGKNIERCLLTIRNIVEDIP